MRKRLSMASCLLAAIAGALLSSQAGAAPITFRMTVPNASGSNNGVPFANQTVAITVQADTTQVIPAPAMIGGPGNCVPALSTSISVGGGAPVSAVAPVFFCSGLNAGVTGIFTIPTASTPSFYFVADYSNAGITNFALASNFPLTSNVATHTAATTSPLNLAGGGIAGLTTVPATGATFAASLGGAVPTLGQYGVLVLAALLAIAGGMALRQRTRA